MLSVFDLIDYRDLFGGQHGRCQDKRLGFLKPCGGSIWRGHHAGPRPIRRCRNTDTARARRSMPICGAPRWTRLSFMPLGRSADPNGGVIITDWYNDPSQADERVQGQCRDWRARPCAPMRCALHCSVRNRCARNGALGEHRRQRQIVSAARAIGEHLVLTRARDYSKVARQSAK